MIQNQINFDGMKLLNNNSMELKIRLNRNFKKNNYFIKGYN